MEPLPVHLLALVIGLTLAGCAASGTSSKKPSREASTAFGASSQWRSADPAVMQRDVMGFADRFAGTMAATYDELAARSPSPAAANAALDRKIGNVTAAYINATRPSPIVGLIDMIVTVTLLRHASEDPWFTEMYGADAAKVVASLATLEADVWGIGSRYLTDSQLVELREAIDRWRRDHPDERYVSTVRLADFPEARSPPPADAKGATSVFGLLFLDPLAGIDPAVREVTLAREGAERMFFYAQRMPVLLSWQSEAVSRHVLDLRPIQQLVGSATRASEFADAATSIADSAKRLPQTIADERVHAVELVAQKVAAEREQAVELVAQRVATERDTTIKQLAQAVAAERTEIARDTSQAVASERDAMVAAFNTSLQAQGKDLVSEMETASSRAVNRIAVLAGMLVALGILLATLAVLIVRRIAPRATGGADKPRRRDIAETGATKD